MPPGPDWDLPAVRMAVFSCSGGASRDPRTGGSRRKDDPTVEMADTVNGRRPVPVCQLWLLVLSAGLLAVTDPARATAVDPAVPDVVIEGRGFGHGVGMSQEGAYAMALAGAGLEEILQTFYPGTSLGRRGGPVHVALLDRPASSVVVSLATGGSVHEGEGADHSPGFPIDVRPGGSLRISSGGGHLRVSPLDGASIAARPAAAAAAAPPSGAAPSTPTTVPTLLGIIPVLPAPTTSAPTTTTVPPPAPAEPDWPSEPRTQRALTVLPNRGGSVGLPELGRIYRGSLEARSGAGGVQVLNTLDVEEYIRGMGEVLDGSWPTAALQAQAVAARTYAMNAMAAGRPLCSSQQCQVYLGQTAEYAAMNRAVAATQGQVLMYRGSLAEAVYSANTGGVTATPEEGFGMTGATYPYLVSSPHRTNDPQAWEVRFPLETMSARLRYPGRPSGVTVSRTGPSGRALEITFSGDAGPYAVPGHRVMTDLSLRSSLFTLRIEGGPQPDEPAEGAAAAPPPAGVRARPVAFEAGGVGPRPLGRAPWTALATLLLAGWAVAMRRHLPHARGRTGDRSKTSAV